MGADVTIVVDVEMGCARPDEVLARISGTYSTMKAIWDLSFEIPSNAGFKALDIERFKAEYTKNWSMECIGVPAEIDGLGGSACQFTGPYGFSADLFNDTLVLNHSTRWAALKRNEKVLQRFIETAKLVAEAMQSKKIILLPDSGREVACLDFLSEEYWFSNFFECLNNSAVHLKEVEFVSNSQTLKIYIMDI